MIAGDQCTVREQVRTAVGELHEVLEKLSNKTITRLPTTSLGGLPDKVLSCAFVAGLPDAVRQLLRASCRMDMLTIEQLLARARAIMSEETAVVAAARSEVTSS